MISGWLGIMLLTAEGVESMDRLKVLLGRIVFGATGMAALGIMQFFTGLDITKYIVIPGLRLTSLTPTSQPVDLSTGPRRQQSIR